ncbi:MAG: mannose-1-phosphate guanylyltransferase/mannose-6-phosphate isomerase [Cytophagia bacterium]|nr:mannose-1-phosphate guanylyltransferase/mannose-6-phosphate isomerase [Cytophagia bacterium]
MFKDSITPIILCGGKGSRLWPLSRESFPKQFLAFNNKNNKSLLQNTNERILPLGNLNNPILICNEEHRFIVAEQMRESKIEPHSIVLEPFGKNTAPAIIIGALIALEKDYNPFILVLSSDHLIKNELEFINVIQSGLPYAESGDLVTFGIVPTSPDTGYGYIEAEKPFKKDQIAGNKIIKFFEKPKLEIAKKFIKDERFTWNSGMFLFKAEAIIKEAEKICPEILELCESSIKEKLQDYDFRRLNHKEFEKLPNISFDVAIMEKTKKGIVLPLNAGWSDIGNWKSVWENSHKDSKGNVIKGQVITKNSENCLLRSESRLMVGIGLKNLTVVETSDAILIAGQQQSQEVKKIVEELKTKGINEGHEHKKIYRPWGDYLSVADGNGWQVKLITVKAGGELSLQMHHHRSEHWVVVKGTAKVEIDSKISILSTNQSTYIPLGAKHRLSNPGKIPLLLIEIQSGSYLGEDDIVRFEDSYGRTNY